MMERAFDISTRRRHGSRPRTCRCPTPLISSASPCRRSMTSSPPPIRALSLNGPRHADRTIDAGPVADHDRRQARQMVEEGRRPIKAGDVIAEIETDKATMEFEAVDEARSAKFWCPKARKTSP